LPNSHLPLDEQQPVQLEGLHCSVGGLGDPHADTTTDIDSRAHREDERIRRLNHTRGRRTRLRPIDFT